MKLKPLKQWYCDHCGGIIDEHNGLLIWKMDDKYLYHDFRIVHTGKCDDYKDYPMSNNIYNVISCDGLAYLLNLMKEVKDINSFSEIIKRLHIKNYEEYRDIVLNNWEDYSDLEKPFYAIQDIMIQEIRRTTDK
jgi:hypothetical protein